MIFYLRAGRRASGLQHFSHRLLASAAVVALVFGQAANANPVGGTVTSGKATISTPASGTLQIDQTTKIVIINWNSFNIAGGETTRFVQPNASAIAVNRIGGSDPSTILGSLLANGKVVLINGNGILFGKGATVNVGSLLATTSDASDADIASGKAKFDKAGNPNAQIINQGNITAASDGMVGLIAPAVSNSGTITAKLGTVHLGASNVFTVDFTGDGLVSFPVDGNVVAAAIGKNGKVVEALVVNDGKISGGTVVLTARAAANLVTNVISMKGVIAATSAHQAGGKIVLDGGDSGDINVAGSLDASGTSGGNISVVSQGITSISGTITARNSTGTGGSIETSGHNLKVAGTVNAGSGGSWLLDPYDLTVDATAASTINTSLGGGTDVTLTTAAGSASGPGTQNASGHGDIIINSAISWSTAAAFTLSAYRDIDINANITASVHGALSLTTGTGTTGDYNIASGKSISFTGGSGSGASLSINGDAYTLLYSMSDVQAINVDAAALAGNYAFAASLNASSVSSWIPIGTDGLGNVGNSGNGFSGVFTGLGHTISNLKVDTGSHHNYAGLFGYLSGTTRDIGMVGGSVSGYCYVGWLVGYNFEGMIANAYATGVVSGVEDVGGLVGVNDGGTITNAYSTGSVSGGNYTTGGLVGSNSGTISNAHATGAVSGGNYVGGLTGHSIGTITNTYATGMVSGTGNAVGGLAGGNGGLPGDNTGTITQSYATGAVSGGSGKSWAWGVGGLVGYNTGTITDTHATGAVSSGVAGWGTGGLVGWIEDGTISNAYATGAVGGGSYGTMIGGLVGENDVGTINNAYATGAVSGGSNGTEIGGLAGHNSGTISNAHATGKVSGGSNGAEIGGLVGRNLWTISNSYAVGAVSGTDRVGGLVGISYFSSTITQSHATGAVSGANYIGGLVGDSVTGFYQGTSYISAIIQSYATGKVSGTGYDIGGLVGRNYLGSTISHAYAKGTVSGGSASYNVGGLVGYNFEGPIGFSYATGAVKGGRGSYDVGGLVGYNVYATINSAYATGAVSGGSGSTKVGGLVGWNVGSMITQSRATGAVSGSTYIGGLVGESSSEATVTKSYATGAVSGVKFIGGLVGLNYYGGTKITESYATGAVSSNATGPSSYVGGLVGKNVGTIADTYAIGAVSAGGGGTYVGGLVGMNDGVIAKSYWDTETSGQSSSDGGTGKTTAQLQGTLPAGFNPLIWGTGSGLFPYLNWQYPTPP